MVCISVLSRLTNVVRMKVGSLMEMMSKYPPLRTVLDVIV